MQRELLTITDLSRMLSVKASWLYQNHKALGLPSIKLGKQVRFDPADVEAFLTAKKRQSGKASVLETDSARGGQYLRGV
jgi:excisionase family DNA binding protein